MGSSLSYEKINYEEEYQENEIIKHLERCRKKKEEQYIVMGKYLDDEYDKILILMGNSGDSIMDDELVDKILLHNSKRYAFEKICDNMGFDLKRNR